MALTSAPPAEPPSLRARSLRGFVLIGGQRAASLLVTAVGGIALARLLGPEVFGVYAMLSFAVMLGVVFSDVGLGAALLQRRDLDPATSLAPAFAAQLALALVAALVIEAVAPAAFRRLGLDAAAVAPVRALALLVPLTVLRMPAAVVLERNLTYGPLVVADTLETLVFHAVAITLAWHGHGVWSFVLGAFGGRLASLAVLWPLAGWWPSGRWRMADLRPLLGFGAFFQGSALVTMVRDGIVPVFVAAWSGAAAVGFLNWASTLAYLPLNVVSIAGRVLFPTLARLQHDRVAFARAAERALNRVALLLYPAALLLLAAAEPVVRLVYGERWLPAVPAVRIFCVCAVLGGTSTVLVQALHGLGRADIVFRLNILWTILLWGVTLLAVPALGFVGFALASAGVAATAPVTAVALRRLAPVDVLRPVATPALAAAAAAVVMGALTAVWIDDLASLAAAGVVAALVYGALVLVLAGADWRAEMSADWRTVWQRRA